MSVRGFVFVALGVAFAASCGGGDGNGSGPLTVTVALRTTSYEAGVDFDSVRTRLARENGTSRTKTFDTNASVDFAMEHDVAVFEGERAGEIDVRVELLKEGVSVDVRSTQVTITDDFRVEVVIEEIIDVVPDGDVPDATAENPLPGYDPAALDDGNLSQIRNLASASAVRLHWFASGGYMNLDGPMTDVCPTVVTEGDTETLIGDGCSTVDDDGDEINEVVTWNGTMTKTGTVQPVLDFVNDLASVDGMIELDNWQLTKPVPCGDSEVEVTSLVHGTAVYEYVDGHTEFSFNARFSIETADETCATTTTTGATIYSGTVEGPGLYNSTWNGHGFVGFSEPDGYVEATSEDVVLNLMTCQRGAVSGTTTVESQGDVVTFTYPPLCEKDEEDAFVYEGATWTWNGDERGELAGVNCATHPQPTRSGALFVFGALAALGLARRRYRRLAATR